MGCIHLYCGDGKGKTTAAIGQAVRAAGRNYHVIIARFLKDDDSGEVEALKQMKRIQILPCEKSFGFTWHMTEEQKKEAREYYNQLLKQADLAISNCSSPVILLILDEICAAINHNLVNGESVAGLLDKWKDTVEIVLTGREPSQELIERADYISEIKKKKHPFDTGIGARKGIEY